MVLMLVVSFDTKECIGDTKLITRETFLKPLTVVIAFSYNVTKTAGPSFVVTTNICIEVAQY